MSYFPVKETKCQLTNRAGPCPHCHGVNDIKPMFRTELNAVRKIFGKAIPLSNAMRCPGRNKDAGGSPNSKHMLGFAADMKIVDARDRARLTGILLSRGWSVGIYTWGIHGDWNARPEPVLWRGNT